MANNFLKLIQNFTRFYYKVYSVKAVFLEQYFIIVFVQYNPATPLYYVIKKDPYSVSYISLQLHSNNAALSPLCNSVSLCYKYVDKTQSWWSGMLGHFRIQVYSQYGYYIN